MPPVAAIVGADNDLAQLPELGFEDDPLFGAATDDAEHGDPAALQALGNRMHHRRAHAASNAQGAARGNELRRVAEWPGDVRNGLTRLERHQFLGALAD